MPSPITPDLTLRQIVRDHPAAARVLQRYPLARVKDRWSLQQLSPFADQAGVPLKDLLKDLSRAADLPLKDPDLSPDLPPPAARTPRHGGRDEGARTVGIMLTALLICLTLGGGWGLYLLLSISFAADYQAAAQSWIHVHGTEQLWGWVGLTIFGVGSYLLHQTARNKPPRWLGTLNRTAVLAGLVLFAATLATGPTAAGGYLSLAASCLLFIAAYSFAFDVVGSLAGRLLDTGLLFVLMSVLWLLVWAAADVTTRWVFRGQETPTTEARALLIQLPVLGFFTNMILGFGIRLIPGLLNITKLRHRAFLIALPVYNFGLILMLAAPPLQRVGLPVLGVAWLGVVGAALMLFAAVIYATGMRLFVPTKPIRPIYGVDPRGGILIPIAYLWFVIALTMILIERLGIGLDLPVGAPFTGAYRHALTVGFVTTMILGVGQRLVPVFVRQELVTPRAFIITAVLIVVGNAWRVVCELWTLTGSATAYRVMGISGILELIALALFALTIARTLRASRQHYHPGTPILPGTRVREAINAYPHLQGVLSELGIDALDETPAIAPSMRVGGLAIVCLWEPGELAAQLEARRR